MPRLSIFHRTKDTGNLIVITMMANIGMATISLLTGMLAARLLGPMGRGELAAIQTIPTFLSAIAMLGVPDALVYYSAKNLKQAGQWLSTSYCIALVSMVPFAIVGYWLMPWLLMAQSDEVISAARHYLLWLLPIYVFFGMPSHVLRGRNDLIVWNFMRATPTLLWLIVLSTAYVTKTIAPNVITSQYLNGMVLLSIFTIYVARKRIPGSWLPQVHQVKKLLKYGLPAVLSTIPTILNSRFDQMLMAAFLSPAILGLYAVAVAWSSAVLPLSSAIPNVLMPKLASMNSDKERSNALAKGTRMGTLVVGIIILFIATLSPVVIPTLFGPDYSASIVPAVVLCFANGFWAMKQLLRSGFYGLGHPRHVLVAELIGLICTGILLWLLIEKYELLGAAVASLVSYFFACSYLIWQMRRITGFSAKELMLPTRKELMELTSRIKTLTSGFVSKIQLLSNA